MEKKVLQEPLKSEKLLEIIDTPPSPKWVPQKNPGVTQDQKEQDGGESTDSEPPAWTFLNSPTWIVPIANQRSRAPPSWWNQSSVSLPPK